MGERRDHTYTYYMQFIPMAWPKAVLTQNCASYNRKTLFFQFSFSPMLITMAICLSASILLLHTFSLFYLVSKHRISFFPHKRPTRFGVTNTIESKDIKSNVYKNATNNTIFLVASISSIHTQCTAHKIDIVLSINYRQKQEKEKERERGPGERQRESRAKLPTHTRTRKRAHAHSQYTWKLVISRMAIK